MSAQKPVQELDRVIIRFAGDSGDGMQLTGDRFTAETAMLGNDLATLPDFPAEIRAPAGSLPGVSGFQLHFADHDILTPGDQPNVLVAMNPAALRTNVKDLPEGGTLIVNRDAFSERNLQKAGYDASPIEDGSLSGFKVHAIPLTSMTVEALKDIEGITSREAERSKNMFALGLMSWLYGRPTERTVDFIAAKFAKRPEIVEANTRAFMTGYAFGETSEEFVVSYEVKPATLAAGRLPADHRQHGARVRPDRRLGQERPRRSSSAPTRSRPRRRSSRSSRGTRTSACARSRRRTRSRRSARRSARASAARSASRPPRGPGDRAEVRDDRPRRRRSSCRCSILDIQRAGPSTGMPTKPEQADLLMVLFGRNSESPVPVLAPATPSDCFDVAIEAARIALKYRTPVYLLSDAYLANGSEPWLIPDVGALPPIDPGFTTDIPEDGEFLPYLARPGDARAAVGDPGHAGPRAPDRRAREADGTRERRATTPTTTT